MAAMVALMTQRKIAHIISGLGVGGAETFLSRLIRSMKDAEHFVMSLAPLREENSLQTELMPYVKELKSLNMGRLDLINPLKFFQLQRWTKKIQPHLIQTWMYHGNLLGGWAGYSCGIPVVWNIRNGPMSAENPESLKINSLTNMIIKLGAVTSDIFPHKIVYNSLQAMNLHEGWGYEEKKSIFIENGYDLKIFKPCAQLRRQSRQAWGIGDHQKVIGCVARFHPQKDIPTLLEAARLFLNQNQNVRFVLCGTGMDSENQQLQDWIKSKKLEDVIILLGRQKNVQALYNGFDIMTLSSSFGEGFPNVIAEAMACGIPCVATDLGETRAIMGGFGKVVPIARPQALMEAWQEALGTSWSPDVLHQRIEEKYALQGIVNKYDRLYEEILGIYGKRT